MEDYSRISVQEGGRWDPEGSEVAMLEKNNYTGIITFPDFKIPSNPKYGLWTIKAKYKEDFTTTGTAYFDVNSRGTDVLPRSMVLCRC